MKRLLLMRHAKSSWENPDLDDRLRPLNDRGRNNADIMGAWMAHHDLVPDFVVTSGTERSRETWERAKKRLKTKAKTRVADALYSAGPDGMLRTLRDVPKKAKTVLMIGHQPVLSSFARKLANGTTPHACARAYKKFPTAAIAVIAPRADKWAEVEYGQSDFLKFSCPKELVDA